MTMEFHRAARREVGLLIGLAGSSGSGKTYSALRLASGLADGKPFAVIDTEAGRALHYADQFPFDHGDLRPPFRPEAYADAIAAADEAGYPVIVIDSASHEHAGDGGLLDWHEEELQRMAGDDYKRREAVKMAAWIKPKRAHKAMMQRLLQVRAHLILCFRAEERIEMVRGADGKLEVRPKRTLTGLDGWIPVCEKTVPYELTLSVLLVADQPGIPRPIKLQEQHRPFVPLDQPLGEEAGRLLGEWARGTATVSALANPDASEPDPEPEPDGEEDAPAVSLRDRLLDLAWELGVKPEMEQMIDRNRAANTLTPAKHESWLKRQVQAAERKLQERDEGGQSQFAIPTGARHEDRG